MSNSEIIIQLEKVLLSADRAANSIANDPDWTLYYIIGVQTRIKDILDKLRKENN